MYIYISWFFWSRVAWPSGIFLPDMFQTTFITKTIKVWILISHHYLWYYFLVLCQKVYHVLMFFNDYFPSWFCMNKFMPFYICFAFFQKKKTTKKNKMRLVRNKICTIDLIAKHDGSIIEDATKWYFIKRYDFITHNIPIRAFDFPWKFSVL